MTSRRYLLAALVVVAVLAGAGCGGDEPSSSSPAKLTPVQLMLGFAVQGQDSTIAVGIEEGFFAEEGIELTILGGESSAATTATVASGGAEFGITDLATVALAHAEDETVPVKAISSLHAVAPYVIYSMKDGANIAEPSDLDGATLYISSQSTIRQLVDTWAAKNGFGGYEFGESDSATASQLLLTGDISSQVTYVTNRVEFEAEAAKEGKEVVSLWLGEHGMEDFYGNVFVTNTDFAAEHPEIVEGFVHASIRSIQYTFDHPDEAAAALQKDFPTITSASTRFRLESYEQLLTAGGAPIGDLTAAKVASTIGYVIEGLKIDDSVSPEDVVLEGYLK